MTGFLIQRCPL